MVCMENEKFIIPKDKKVYSKTTQYANSLKPPEWRNTKMEASGQGAWNMSVYMQIWVIKNARKWIFIAADLGFPTALELHKESNDE